MSREWQVSDSVEIAVDPQTVYAQVSDVTQMGRWSPENTGAVLDRPGESALVGMRFVGWNRRGPLLRWATACEVTVADPGERFAFRVDHYGFGKPLLPISVATWDYRFEAIDGGTRVTETWTDDRRLWPDVAAGLFDRIATGGSVFADFQRANIRDTLDNLKRELEQAE